MNKIQDGWFSEVNDMWPGQSFGLRVKEVLHREKSEYQNILIFQSETYGRVLALDGVIQCTERDEFSYQEPIAHLPLFSHPNPRKVLVVGGGDGGVLREVAKHPMVEEIHLCEIDERVIELSKEFLPQLSVGFSDPRVQVHIQDGTMFLNNHHDQFDVIITDSSDPIGPAIQLFELPYYKKIMKALRADGITCAQGECTWLDMTVIQSVLKITRNLFPVVSYANVSVPTYPAGTIGFILASKNKDTVFERPLRTISDQEADNMNLQYYDSSVHPGLFTLPRFAQKALEV